MQGRWTIYACPECGDWMDGKGIEGSAICGGQRGPHDQVDVAPMPVVPCDDAAIDRAARAIHRARGLSDGSFGMDAYCECREFAEAMFRAAGETP